jgi:hypothetical protein
VSIRSREKGEEKNVRERVFWRFINARAHVLGDVSLHYHNRCVVVTTNEGTTMKLGGPAKQRRKNILT